MNLYEYQRSRPFIDFGPRSLRFNILKLLFLKKNKGTIEAIFHVESSWDGRMKASINGPLCFCMGKKVKTMDFSEITVVYDIKVGGCSQLNEYMKLYEYQRSRSFIDLDPNYSIHFFF